MRWLFALPRLFGRVRRLETQMSDLQGEVQQLDASEQALEARVKAHEEKDAATLADLNTQIAALKAGQDNSATIAALETVRQRIEAFDTDTAPPAA